MGEPLVRTREASHRLKAGCTSSFTRGENSAQVIGECKIACLEWLEVSVKKQILILLNAFWAKFLTLAFADVVEQTHSVPQRPYLPQKRDGQVRVGRAPYHQSVPSLGRTLPLRKGVG